LEPLLTPNSGPKVGFSPWRGAGVDLCHGTAAVGRKSGRVAEDVSFLWVNG